MAYFAVEQPPVDVAAAPSNAFEGAESEPVTEETEDVELIRMGPLVEPKTPEPTVDESSPVGFQVAVPADVPEVEAELVSVEPETPPGCPRDCGGGP